MRIYNVICAEKHYDQGEQPCINEVHSTSNSETAKKLFFEEVENSLDCILNDDDYKINSEKGTIWISDEVDCEIDYDCNFNHNVNFWYFLYWDGNDSYKVVIQQTDLLD